MISVALNTDGVKIHFKMETFWFPNWGIMREAMRELGLVAQSFCSCPLIHQVGLSRKKSVSMQRCQTISLEDVQIMNE